MEQSKYWKPKFSMTAFVQIMSTVALFSGHIDQGGYITVSTLSLGMFTAGSVVENKFVQPPRSET
jgi:hypothetical protein